GGGGGRGGGGAAVAVVAAVALAPGQPGLADRPVRGRALPAGAARRAAAGGLAGRRADVGHAQPAQVLLEQLRTPDALGAAGRVRAPEALGGAVPRGGQGLGGLGPVPGSAVAGLPPARGDGHAGVQLPGVAGVGATAAGTPARQEASAFFPLARTAGGCRCRRSIDASSTGYGCKPPANWLTRDASLSSTPCAGDKAVLTGADRCRPFPGPRTSVFLPLAA